MSGNNVTSGGRLIHEYEQPNVTRPKRGFPTLQSGHVIFRGPALPDARRRPAAGRKTPPLNIDKRLGAALTMDDEVEALDRPVRELRPPSLVNGQSQTRGSWR